MAGKGRVPKSLEGRSLHASGATRHGAIPVISHVAGHRQLDPMHHQELLETKIAAQAAEIKQLFADNQRLVSAHTVLREELLIAKQEAERLKAHMRSLKTESDIQVRVLVEKIARAEVTIKAGEAVKKDVQQAFKEAQSLVAARKEMTLKIQEANKELQRANDDINSLLDLQTELDSLRREEQRLRDTFEYEKSSNREQVEQLQAMEQKLILMAKEVENLRIDVLNTEKRGKATQYNGYMNPVSPYPRPIQGNAPYVHEPIDHRVGLWPAGEEINGDASNPTGTDDPVPASVVASASTSEG